jgi:UDP-glucose 4-epimerase
MKTKTILITGVAGLLGSRLADWIILNHPEYDVIGIDDLSGGYFENIHPTVKFYRRTLGVDSIKDIFETHSPNIVFHFAAYAAEALSPFVRKYNYTNNLLATVDVVNECINFNVDRLVFTSSMAVYGNGKLPFNEDDIRQPIDSYGIAKSACEQDIEAAGIQHGLDWCIIRPHNFYGEKQNIWDSYRNVLGIWMYKKITDQPLTIFGDGEQRRAFSCIDDSLPCLWNAGILPEASKQIINLGGIEQVSIKEAAHILSEIMGGCELTYLPPRHEVKNAFPTWEKSVNILGFKHTTSLAEGLTKMWEWAKTQPLRERQVFTEYEVNKNLYTFWEQDILIKEAPTSKLVGRKFI